MVYATNQFKVDLSTTKKIGFKFFFLFYAYLYYKHFSFYKKFKKKKLPTYLLTAQIVAWETPNQLFLTMALEMWNLSVHKKLYILRKSVNLFSAGGPWLITDMRRGETIFEIDPHLQDRVDQGIESEGSNLSGVNSRCSWEEPGEGSNDFFNEDNNHTHEERRNSSDLERPRISDFGKNDENKLHYILYHLYCEFYSYQGMRCTRYSLSVT